MYCSICTHPNQINIVVDYIYTASYRLTAKRYGVGYRSLQRHIDKCIASIFAEREEREYQAEFERCSELVKEYFTLKQRQPKPRKKSIITKPITYSWSRRAWKDKAA